MLLWQKSTDIYLPWQDRYHECEERSPLGMQQTEKPRPRRRDASETRRRLVEAARRRFARDGYTATTVREIAEDAGVNVALISRYFESKEGLFEACLASAAAVLVESADQAPALEHLAETIVQHVNDAKPDGGLRSALLLLLRSSGDEAADQMRLATLRGYGVRIASLAGWSPDPPGTPDLLLRAQLVLAAAIGIAILGSLVQLEPLASASEEELGGPLSDLVGALLVGAPEGH
jgi:AcrR family transcriptional regulator